MKIVIIVFIALLIIAFLANAKSKKAKTEMEEFVYEGISASIILVEMLAAIYFVMIMLAP